MILFEGDKVRYANSRRKDYTGTVMEYDPVDGCELDVLVIWNGDAFQWEKSSELVRI